VTAWEHHVPLAFHSGREADHSPPSSAEVKEWVELCLHSPNAPSWRGARLGRAQGQFYLTFTFTFIHHFHLKHFSTSFSSHFVSEFQYSFLVAFCLLRATSAISAVTPTVFSAERFNEYTDIVIYV